MESCVGMMTSEVYTEIPQRWVVVAVVMVLLMMVVMVVMVLSLNNHSNKQHIGLWNYMLPHLQDITLYAVWVAHSKHNDSNISKNIFCLFKFFQHRNHNKHALVSVTFSILTVMYHNKYITVNSKSWHQKPKSAKYKLNHWCRVMHINSRKLGHHWFR